MKLWLVTAVVLGATPAGAQVPMNDPNFDTYSRLLESVDGAWRKDPDTGAWLAGGGMGDLKGSSCVAELAQLAAAKVPDSQVLSLRNDAPGLAAGKHTLAEIRKDCEQIDRLKKIAAFEFWADSARGDLPNLATGNFQLKYYKNCLEVYDKVVKLGIPGTERVPERKDWSGTLEDLRKKYCDVGLAKAKAADAKREAPYRKLLAADKLDLALVDPTFTLAGGHETSDPGKLAAASVWFRDTSLVNDDRPTCKGGRDIHTVHRYTFDGGGKLVEHTQHEYCGTPPPAAYK